MEKTRDVSNEKYTGVVGSYWDTQKEKENLRLEKRCYNGYILHTIPVPPVKNIF